MAPSIADLVPDLHFNILSRKPIKHLMQLRCVSKQWRSIIDSPFFSDFYLSRSSSRNEQCALHLETINLGILEEDRTDKRLKPSYVSIPKLNLRYHTVYNLEGSCKGLLLFTCKMKACFTVENPFNKGPLMLPKLEHKYRGRKICGLGCEKSTNKFKVVCVHEDEDDGDEVNVTTRSRTLVHTLGTTSWREICETPPCSLSDNNNNKNSVYADGCLHWLVQSSPEHQNIVSFNVGEEKFGFTPHPDEFRASDSGLLLGLFDFQGDLGMADRSCAEYIDIWVLKVVHDMKKWKRECRIGMQTLWVKRWVLGAREWEWALEKNFERQQRTRGRMNNGDIKVIGLWKEETGEILLQSKNMFLVYSPESDITKSHESWFSFTGVICHQPTTIRAHSII